MKLLAYFIPVLLFSCGEIISKKNNQIDLSPIENELSGSALGEPIKYINKSHQSENLDVVIFSKNNKNKVAELDIHFKNLTKTTYSQLRELYNSNFNTSYTDTVFNTWQTDSTEFILYKNSDSSILVNIYKRK